MLPTAMPCTTPWKGASTRRRHQCAGAGADRSSDGWPKNPRALAGRLRRSQTFLRVLGIDITFSREGRAGNRIIAR
jgi:hypothetical protein